MDLFWKAVAGALLTAVLGLTLGKWAKDMDVLLSMAVSCMIAMIVIAFLEPVLDFLYQLEVLGDLQGDLLGILLKSLGIGLVAEISGMVCIDAGKSSLAKTLQMLGGAVILWLSIPVFNALLDLVQQILGEV